MSVFPLRAFSPVLSKSSRVEPKAHRAALILNRYLSSLASTGARLRKSSSLIKLLIPQKRPASEAALNVTVQRPHDADAREHRRSALICGCILQKCRHRPRGRVQVRPNAGCWRSIGSSSPADVSPKSLHWGMGDSFRQLPPPMLLGRRQLPRKVGCFLAGCRSFIAGFE